MVQKQQMTAEAIGALFRSDSPTAIRNMAVQPKVVHKVTCNIILPSGELNEEEFNEDQKVADVFKVAM